MNLVDMHTLDGAQLEQAAQMLVDELPLGWPTLADALQEVRELFALQEDCSDGEPAFLAALEGSGASSQEVIGWCGILPSYAGRVWELHPLVVRHDWQRKSVGTAIVRALENIARERGGLTLWLGADDEAPEGETSFAGADLYDDLPKHIREFDPGTHQSAFYLKLGFQIIGVMPDANGRGKPDIFMAKRL